MKRTAGQRLADELHLASSAMVMELSEDRSWLKPRQRSAYRRLLGVCRRVEVRKEELMGKKR